MKDIFVLLFSEFLIYQCNLQTLVSRKLSNHGPQVRICLFYFGKLEISNTAWIHFKVPKLHPC